MDISQIIQLKLMSKIINNKGDLDLSQLMIVQSLTNGRQLQLSDVIKTKLMEKILNGDENVENLPLDKLMLYQMLSENNLDIGKLVQYKLTMKLLGPNLFDEDSDVSKKS